MGLPASTLMLTGNGVALSAVNISVSTEQAWKVTKAIPNRARHGRLKTVLHDFMEEQITPRPRRLTRQTEIRLIASRQIEVDRTQHASTLLEVLHEKYGE